MMRIVYSIDSLRMTFSIYIPHVFLNISKERIGDAFEFCEYGVVERIDFVTKMKADGKCYNSAFVHFSHWYDNDSAIRFRDKIQDPEKQARLVYDDPWYWIVLPNTAKAVLPGSRKNCLDIDCEMNLVDDEYAAKLEKVLRILRDENQLLKDELDRTYLLISSSSFVKRM